MTIRPQNVLDNDWHLPHIMWAMNLAKYIEVTGDAESAALFKTKERTVKSWRLRERFPRRNAALRIVKVTKGIVTLAGIYEVPAKAKA